MELAYVKLDSDQISTALRDAPGWSIEDGKLSKQFKFDAYLKGAEFASAVANGAENLNHHPDILVGYKKVTVSVNTHDVGGISPYDFELARRIEAI